MTGNEPLWWEAEAWNQQTLDFFATANPEPDERFITAAFRTLETEYVPFRPSTQLPSSGFLNSAYGTLGVPMTAPSGQKPYSKQSDGWENMSAFEQWSLYYDLLASDTGRLDLYSEPDSRSQPVSRICRDRAFNYLNTTKWTADEAYKVANVIARRQLGGRFPELGAYPLSKIAYVFNERNTNQHRTWQAFLRNPHLPNLGKPEGHDKTVWEMLVDQILHVCSVGRNKTHGSRLLPYLVSNPSIPVDLLKECERMIEESPLTRVEKTAVFRQFGRNRLFDGQVEQRMKQLAEKVNKFELPSMLEHIRAGNYHVTSTWATTSLVCAERPETEGFAREVIAAASDGGNWDLLAYFAPMVGKVIADQEKLLGVEPSTVPAAWLLAAA